MTFLDFEKLMLFLLGKDDYQGFATTVAAQCMWKSRH